MQDSALPSSSSQTLPLPLPSPASSGQAVGAELFRQLQELARSAALACGAEAAAWTFDTGQAPAGWDSLLAELRAASHANPGWADGNTLVVALGEGSPPAAAAATCARELATSRLPHAEATPVRLDNGAQVARLLVVGHGAAAREPQHRQPLLDSLARLASLAIGCALAQVARPRATPPTPGLDAVLQAREAELRLVVDSSPSMLAYWDHELRNRFANHAYATWFGVDPEALRGKHIRELLGEELFQKNLPFLEAALGGSPQVFERELATPEGRRHSLARYQPHVVDGRVVGVLVEVTDVSQLKTIEHELRKEIHTREDAESKLRASFDALAQAREQLESVVRDQHAMLNNDMIGIMRVRRREVVWVNRAFERMFEYRADEIIGRSTRVLYLDPASHAEQGREAYPLLRAQGTYRTQVRMRRKSGSTIWVDMSGAMLSLEGDESLWMAQDITALQAQRESVESIAFQDSLTGLTNRAGLLRWMARALRERQTTGDLLALAFIDLDGFKPINDRYGHDAGDEVLDVVAQRLLQSLRLDDLAARLGGDEFVVVLPHAGDHASLGLVCDRLIETLRQPIDVFGTATVRVSASMGVSLCPEHASTLEGLMRCADEAMYMAKASGRNAWRFYEGDA